MITALLLEQVAAAVTPQADQAELRRQFPGVAITVCSDDDLPARFAAVRETAAARFYYLDAGEQCGGRGANKKTSPSDGRKKLKEMLLNAGHGRLSG